MYLNPGLFRYEDVTATSGRRKTSPCSFNIETGGGEESPDVFVSGGQCWCKVRQRQGGERRCRRNTGPKGRRRDLISVFCVASTARCDR